MTIKSHLATLAHYPSLLVSSTAKTALMEIERLETALAISKEASEHAAIADNKWGWHCYAGAQYSPKSGK